MIITKSLRNIPSRKNERGKLRIPWDRPKSGGGTMINVVARIKVKARIREDSSLRDGPFEGGPRAGGVGAGLHHTQTQEEGTSAYLTKALTNHVWSEEIRPNVFVELTKLGFVRPAIDSNSAPVGGRLALFQQNWESITRDHIILEAISGYKIEFIETPETNWNANRPQHMKKENLDIIEKEIAELLTKRAVEMVEFPHHDHIQVFSNIFIRPKRDGGLRPIFNLKELNKFIQYEHFKMEGFYVVKNLLQKGDYMVKVDLKDAYLTVKVHESVRKFLRFRNSRGQVLQFRALPFGLASGPRLFTKIMKPVVALLRRLGVRLVIYLDDILIMNKSRISLERDRDSLIWLLQNLGFIVNWEKSELTPCQKIEFLGLTINSALMEVSLSPEKIQKILTKCKSVLTPEKVTIQEVASLLGLLNSSREAIVPTTLYVRQMQMHQIKQLMINKTYQAQIELSPVCREEIHWWINHVHHFNGKQILTPSPDLVIETDASNLGWGGVCQGARMGGSLDQRGEILAHKCSRIERSPSSTTINNQSKEKYVSSFKNGQHNCSGPHKPHGGNKIKNTKSNNSPNLGILLGEGDNSHSRIPSWSAKRNGRLGKSSCKIILPVETEYQDIQTTEQNLGPNRGRLVCRQTEQSSPPILQPQTGSRGTGGGCISDRMDEPQCLCVSSILSDNESASKSNQGGIRFNHNNPVLADTRSLPDASEHDDRFSHIVTTNEGTSTVTGRRVPPTSCELDAKTSGMESVREQAKARGFSQGASNLLVSSWRKGTQSSYNTCWKYWNSWCCERNVDPIQAPVEQVANFLAELYNKGYAYSSINSYRSAISACHFGMNGTPIGQHSVICRLMGGIFNERPIQPRYTCTWDVDTVLKFLNSKEDNEKLSLKDLTLKVTILIALSSACRSSEVSRLDMNFMKIDNDSIKFSIPTLTKGRRCGDPPVEIVLGKFQAQPKLDVVSCILEYVNRTQNIREGETILLVSYIKPHKQVRPCTVAKWIQQIMKLSGIDTSTFKAHSTRGASTSKANKQGLSVPQIMKMAKWKSECTFRRFYSRTIEGETGNSDHTFSDAVFHI